MQIKGLIVVAKQSQSALAACFWTVVLGPARRRFAGAEFLRVLTQHTVIGAF